jgi:O-antigen/teichoic acid export membrane protein
MVRHTTWNLIGMCAPMVVALFAIPLLIHGLGRDRFGLLSLVWMLVGYLGIFDLGLGRALTQTVAQRLGEGREQEVPGIFWTALAIMSLLGLTGGLVVWMIAPWLTASALNIEPILQPETLRSFRAVACSLPVIISITGLVGTLEAFRKFGLVNAIRVPTGAYTFIGPLLVLPFSRSLYAVVLALLAGRLVEWMIFFVACLFTIPGARTAAHTERRHVAGLVRFGSWMTITNLISPLLLQIDRFLIGSVRAVGDVTYYATPAEIVIKLLILPRAWAGVLFPSFAGSYQQRLPDTAALFLRACRYLLAGLFPIVAGLIALAPEFLTLWLGPEFGLNSSPVMRLLTAGVFLHSLAFLPNALLQATNRPDLTAKLNLVELPLYLAGASLLIHRFGIVGAASAWIVRAAVDVLFTTRFALRVLQQPGSAVRRFSAVALLDLLAMALLTLPAHWFSRTVCGILFSLIHLAVCWSWLLEKGDRARLLSHLTDGLATAGKWVRRN